MTSTNRNVVDPLERQERLSNSGKIRRGSKRSDRVRAISNSVDEWQEDYDDFENDPEILLIDCE